MEYPRVPSAWGAEVHVIAAILSLVLALSKAPCAQAPDEVPPTAVAVRGMAELTPAAATDSAWEAAQHLFRERWLAHARQFAAVRLPGWVPAWVWQPTFERSIGSLRARQHLAVAHRDEVTREHDFGTSHQVTLWVEEPESVRIALERQLRTEFRALEKRLALKCGGTMVFWLLLAAFVGWVDRLSMGWMSRSLRVTGLLAALGVPIAAVLL